MPVFNNSILEIPKDIGYWLVRADGGKYYEDFLLNNFIAVSDNEITLDLINSCAKESLAGITIDHYKALYNNYYPKWNAQQIAQAAGRTQKFIEEMKIGDIVLVPSKRSSSFLIGVLISDVYEVTENEINSIEKVHYSINPFFKRRKVHWIKEVKRQEISEKLYWILSAHQTIFNLNEEKNFINQLLAPVYIQDGICHGSIKISKKEGLNSNEWYNLHSIIKAQSDNTDEEVIIKTNVQSPGFIQFVSENKWTIISITTMLSGLVIGDVSFSGIKLKGIIPYFQSFKKEQVEISKAKKELEKLEEEKISKQLENERLQFELNKDKEIWETKKLENEIERMRLQLQISSFDAGREISSQTQMDNLGDPSVDEF